MVWPGKRGLCMVEGIEAVGEAVTGGMVARSVEPVAGEGHGHGHGACLNCQTPLVGEFCHACGQHGHVHRTLTAWWHDLAHGVLHLDGKIWRTLPLLAWRPGELTRRYVEGERAKFVSPMAIFLFSVFTMFAVFSLVGGPTTSREKAETAKGATVASETAKAAREMEGELAELERKKAAAVQQGQPTGEIDEDIASQKAAIRVTNNIAAAAGPKSSEERIRSEDGMIDAAGDTTGLPPWLQKPVGKIRHNPELIAYKLQNNAYKFSWALIPISVPFVWMLFMFRRRYRMYDHTVFVTYSLAFMTLLTVAASLVRAITGEQAWGVFALMLVPPFHMYRQLKGAYRLSRFSALWRATLLAIFALIAGGLFFGLLVGMVAV
jgi:hypothetical protein